MSTSKLKVQSLRRDDRLSIIRTNKLGTVNFKNKTDIERLAQSESNISKSSADRVGFHLLVEEYECDKIRIDAQDLLQWTPQGVFTKNNDIAMYLIQMHNAVLLDREKPIS